jgi:hypothetical protein
MDRSRPIFFYPRRSVLTAFLAACFLADAALFASAQAGAAMIAIDNMTPGSPPAGFTFARTGRGGEGEWTVRVDPTAAKGRAIEQTSTDRTDYRFPLAIHEGFSAANLNVEIRFKAVAGKVDQVRFYRVVAGKREQLASANLKVTPNEWHTLGLRAEGRRFTVSYGGKTLFSVTDATFTEAGGVALWTKADSVTRFDQVTITSLP